MPTLRSGDLLIIRLVHGDDFVESLKEALRGEGVKSGVILGGVGMLRNAKLAFYAGDGEYDSVELHEDVELCALNGNISTFEGEYVIHMHATGGKRGGQAVAGHLMSAKVHMTGEIAIMISKKDMIRKVDEDTGLRLLWFD